MADSSQFIRLWVTVSFVFGIGEIVRGWNAYQPAQATTQALLSLHFWEVMLQGNVQKIVSSR